MFSSYYMSLTGHVSPNKMHETDVPVVVISPEDRKQVERLRDLWDTAHEEQEGFRPASTKLGARGNCLQAALRSLLAPSRPEEPTGLGAVVEDRRGVTWVRAGKSMTDPNWRVCGGDAWTLYADITAVKVLSEGVTP